MDNNQLNLLNRKLEELIAPTKITVVGQNRIRIGKVEFEFNNQTPQNQISQKIVTSR